jgi:hypothetical protein
MLAELEELKPRRVIGRGPLRGSIDVTANSGAEKEEALRDLAIFGGHDGLEVSVENCRPFVVIE